jgi:hypothetical protein
VYETNVEEETVMSTAKAAVTGRGHTRHGAPGQEPTAGLAAVRHLARHQVMGLTSVFLLGMAVSLIGLPANTTGVAHIASIAFLAAHVLIAVGIVAGTVMLLRSAVRLGGPWGHRAIASATGVAVAFAAGIITVITHSGWWSYAMAAGFIAALLASGSLLLPAPVPAPDPPGHA